MSFTPEELAAMAAADAEIEAEFFLTNEEAAASKEAVAEYQRRYREANKEKWKQYAAAKKAKKAARGGKPTDGAPEKPA